MIRNLNVLIFLCSVALAVTLIGTLYFFVRGNFNFAGGFGIAMLLFFALMVVLWKDRRVARIMREDDYEKENEEF